MQRFSHHKINLSLIEFESLNIKDFFYKNEISMKTSKIFPISVRTSKVSSLETLNVNDSKAISMTLSEKNHLDLNKNSLGEVNFLKS